MKRKEGIIPRESENSCRTAEPSARSARDAARDQRVLRAASRGDPRARERVVTSHLGLIRAVASRYCDLGVPYDDLVQEGAIGFLEAIDRFDPRRGVSFESYARFRVRRAIRNALTDQARLIRLPKQIVERRRALERVEAELSAAGRTPTIAELAAATGLSPQEVRAAQSVTLQPISLDQPVLPDGTPLTSLIADDSASQPELELLDHEQADSLRGALRKLPERQRRVVNGRWGLDTEPQSNEALAGALALSPRRTQTIARDALYALRGALKPADATTDSRHGTPRSRHPVKRRSARGR